MKKQSDTKKKILETTGKLFSQRGYFGVSMQHIADELNITKSALYYHFKSKDELADMLLRESVAELKQELKTSIASSKLPSDVLFNVIKTFLDFKIDHPEISLLTNFGLMTDPQVPILTTVAELRQELVKYIRGLVESVDTSRKLTYKTMFMITVSIISFVLSPFSHSQEDTKQMAEDLTKLLQSDQ